MANVIKILRINEKLYCITPDNKILCGENFIDFVQKILYNYPQAAVRYTQDIREKSKILKRLRDG